MAYDELGRFVYLWCSDLVEALLNYVEYDAAKERHPMLSHFSSNKAKPPSTATLFDSDRGAFHLAITAKHSLVQAGIVVQTLSNKEGSVGANSIDH